MPDDPHQTTHPTPVSELNTHRAADEIRELPIQRLEGGLGEHVRHRDPSVFGLIGVEFVRNRGQGGGDNRLSDRVSRAQ